MTLWETVWSQVKAEMPQTAARPRTWAGFLGAMIAALLIIAIWFPIRLIADETVEHSDQAFTVNADIADNPS